MTEPPPSGPTLNGVTSPASSSTPMLYAPRSELVDQGETTWGRGSTGFTARVVTFWHGDAVLDIRVTSPSGGGSTLCRVTRRHGACNEQALADCIRTALSTA